MSEKWDIVKRTHVLKAIEVFDQSNVKHPRARNTFLLFNGKEYPAKHIRGMAYEIAHGREISKEEYSGGDETVRFFNKRGFQMRYDKKLWNPTEKAVAEKPPKPKEVLPKQVDKPEVKPQRKKTRTKKTNVVSQKNALQLLIQKHIGYIEVEKKFEWLRTPDINNPPVEYRPIVDALLSYRGMASILKTRQQTLPCDIVVESEKLIIEYDEYQHFSKARHISLENYPESTVLHFSKEEWMAECTKINAHDTNPPDRDERRAFFDSVRDIEAAKNGYRLVRIKHGDVDWESPDVENELLKLLIYKPITNNTSMEKHKIARWVVQQKTEVAYDDYIGFICNLADDFIEENYNKRQYEFILTFGGFIRYNDTTQYTKKQLENDQFPAIIKRFEDDLIQNELLLGKDRLLKLKTIADYLFFGVDVRYIKGTDYIDKIVELVGVYSLKEEKFIRWTGKFYPTTQEQDKLVRVKDLDTHFIELNGQKLLVLGCHDLNVYNPRGQANSTPGSWKSVLSEKFRDKCVAFQPDIVLQHPHTTDTYKIWLPAWNRLKQGLPTVNHYASGIYYYNWGEKQRGTLSEVLEKTKMGDVHDYVVKIN